MFANTVLLCNSLLCPPLGFLFNFLLIWLILRRTPKEMMVHSRILLQTCILDCLILSIESVGQNVFVLDPKDSLGITFYDGYSIRFFQSQWASHPSFLFLIESFWVYLYHLSTFGISVQFVYRYMRLNRDMKVTLRDFLLIFLGPAFLTTLVCFCLGMGYLIKRQNVHDFDRQRFSQFVDIEQRQQQPPFYDTTIMEKNDLVFVCLYCFCLMYIVSYSVIVFCGYKMVRFVHNHATFNARMKELNWQLTKNLIILASFPLLLEICTIITIGYMDMDMGSDGKPWMLQFQFYLFCVTHWLPVLNPLASIYVNRPYQDAVLGRFFKVAPMPNR